LTRPLLFPLADAWWFYASFVAFITLLLVIDLKAFHKQAKAVSTREALAWTLVWTSLALLFALGLWLFLPGVLERDQRVHQLLGPGFNARQIANDLTAEFLTGYIVEMSLSVDNLFVLIVIFAYFAIPTELQRRVLYYGILGAIVLRALFIGIGSILMQFQIIVALMGLFLVYTGIKICRGKEEKIEPEKNPMIRLARRLVPITSQFHGEKFFIREGAKLVATPLFVALIVVESSDIVFAIDSVPAIFGFTRETLIVFTSNMFAILGLRTMYFLLANAVDKFHYLKYGFGIILTFVGAKMSVLHWMGIHVPTTLSLAIVLGVLAISIGVSFAFPKKHEPAPGPPASAG
jgi:tellurite resistance protein TerC